MVAFDETAWPHYLHWQATDASALRKLNTPIEQCRRTPFKGGDKPEPLKGALSGWWSRRLTQEDRLVYARRDRGAIRRWRSRNAGSTTERPPPALNGPFTLDPADAA